MLTDDIAEESVVDVAIDRWRLLHLAPPPDADVRAPSPWAADILDCHGKLENVTLGDPQARADALLALGDDELGVWQAEHIVWLRRELLALGRFLNKRRRSRRSLDGIADDEHERDFVSAGLRWAAVLRGLAPGDAAALGIAGMKGRPADIVAVLELRGHP